MQLLGNTPEEKKEYKKALSAEKKKAGFSLSAFNAQWITTHPELGASADDTPEKIPAVNEANTPADDRGKDHNTTHPENVPGSISAARNGSPDILRDAPARDAQKENKPLQKITGTEYTRENSDDMPEKLRQIINDINGAIMTYKLDNDIKDFSKEKNGAIKFSACLMYVCDNIIRPSKILKRAPYSVKGSASVPVSNNNAYDTDALIAFIDICKRLCACEGLIFNRALYIALTGISDDYLIDSQNRLTSSRINLYEKVLASEYRASLAGAYGSEIGNIRNLNEKEALTRAPAVASGAVVSASELRKLPGG